MVRSTRASRAATADPDAPSVAAGLAAGSQEANGGEQNPTASSERTTLSANSQQLAEELNAGGSQRDARDSERQNGGSRQEDQYLSEEDEDEDEDNVKAKRMSRELRPSDFPLTNANNHIKILLATDNHVGYMERDPVRGQDSINTFREILKIAVERDVDMILLGGDLFHDNKPSRATLHQVMASIRDYCMGDRPISLELLSDPNDGRADGYSFPAVNYEDANLNIGLPIFSIHGNHDDPQGAGIDGALSALDLLSVSGLVNYFGKVELPTDDENAGQSSRRAPDAGGLSDVGIRIRPLLLQKGHTKLALYGMGNIKDERMHYELRANRVRMYRPSETPEAWFNILCVHQNRASHNPKAFVPETMFDDSVDLVVWGHEHEQLIVPQPVGGKHYGITQPGSSVATSLSAGEAQEKCVGIIHIDDGDYCIEPVVLQTVRPFVMDDMALAEEAEDAGVALDDRLGIQKLLKRRIQELVDKANAEWDSKHEDVPEDLRPPPMLPLVRLRVEYDANVDVGNTIRFGQDFVDKVANPRDVLQLSKKKKAVKKKKRQQDGRFEYVEVEAEDLVGVAEHEKIKVGALVEEFLKRQKMELLNAEGLERAISNFVEKDDREAIGHFVGKMMKTYQGSLNSLAPDETQLDAELQRIREQQEKDRGTRAEREAHEPDADKAGRGRGSASTKAKASQPSRGRRLPSDDSMLDDQDSVFGGGDSDDARSRSGSASPAKSRGRGNGGSSSRKSAAPGKSSTQANQRGKGRSGATFLGNDDDDEEMESPEDDLPSRGKAASSSSATASKSRADVLSARKPAAKKTPAARKTATTRRRSASTTPPPTSSRRGAAQKAAKAISSSRGRGGGGSDESMEDGEGSDDGFEIDEEASQAASRRRR